MPEGPEIRRAADELEKQIGGKLIDRIHFGLERLKPWERPLTGATVVSVNTYGKAIVITLDNGLNIYSHNQLYGRWMFSDTNHYPETSRQLRIAIDCQGQSALLFSASDIQVLRHEEIVNHPFIRKLGPDVLTPTITTNDVLARLTSPRFRKRQLGSILTDQTFMAGLGNYLRCEILYVSRLHPRNRSIDINDAQRQKLAESILALARQSYETGGITFDLKTAQQRISEGVAFEDARFYVFRRAGLPCYECGSRIEKIKHGGQPCYGCPVCQE